MNGAHDLGGMHGLEPIDPDPNEPVFHDEWERRVFALTLACGAHGKWNIDMSRFARESMHPADYLATSYYEHWLHGLEVLLVDSGLITDDDIATEGGDPPRPVEGVNALTADRVGPAMAKGSTARVEDGPAPKFAPGDAVVARNRNPLGHTRVPRYARGRRGVIDRDHGIFIFADDHGMGRGKNPQHVYSVRFTARELWGAEASPRDSVHIDLWDDHLDPA
jgi:nitrile hydratase beta subunit